MLLTAVEDPLTVFQEIGDDEESDVYDEDEFFLNYPQRVAPVITDPRLDNTNLEIQAREEARLLQHEDIEQQQFLLLNGDNIRRQHPSHQVS